MSKARSHRIFYLIGGTLAMLAVGIEFATRVATGQLFWLNAKHQPVSIFLYLTVLAIAAVIGLLNLFVWRRQRRAAHGRKSKRSSHW